jgi:ElaB/YqjD/DUF883 family membrane-anchored ribosome-binding protein
MTTSKVPGTAGGAGPEQNLHLDHDSALEALGGPASTSRLDQAKEAVTQTVGQAREAVSQVRETVTDAVHDATDRAQGLYDDARHGVRRAKAGVRDAYDAGAERFDDLRNRGYDAAATGRDSIERTIQENPLLVGVVGLAAGLLLGALLPRTRREVETIGGWTDGYRAEGVRYAREVTQRGRQFVDQTVADIGSHVREARDDLNAPSRASTPGERVGPSGRYQNH